MTSSYQHMDVLVSGWEWHVLQRISYVVVVVVVVSCTSKLIQFRPQPRFEYLIIFYSTWRFPDVHVFSVSPRVETLREAASALEQERDCILEMIQSTLNSQEIHSICSGETTLLSLYHFSPCH